MRGTDSGSGARPAPRRPRGNSISAIAHAIAKVQPHPAYAPGAQHTPAVPAQRSSVFGPLHSADAPITQALHHARATVQRAQQREPTPPPTAGQTRIEHQAARQSAVYEHANHLLPDWADPITRHELGQSALTAKQDRPFDVGRVTRAIQLGLPEAKGLADIGGTIFSRSDQGRSVLQRILGQQGDPLALDPKTGVPYTAEPKYFDGGKLPKGVAQTQGALQKEADPVSAPVLKTLGLLAVPSHEIAKGVGSLTGHPNVQNFGQLLAKSGLPRAAAAPLGFGLDVATDPTTYVSFGAGSVAEHAGEAAATQAERRALQAGMSESGAQMVARRAARAATEAAPTGRGITASFAGHELPFLRNVSAAVGRVAGTGASHAPEAVKGAGNYARDVATNVRPTMAPAGVDAARYGAARQVARESRATTNQGLQTAQAQARGLAKRIGPDNYAQVIDAVERGRIGSLPQELRQPATWLRSQYRYAKRVRQRAGLPEGTIRDYFPHAQETPLRQGLGIETSSTTRPYRGGQRTLAPPGSSKERTLRMPISEANPILAAEGKDPFSTNLPLVHLNYMNETTRAAARSDFLKNLAATGRPVRAGMALRPGEGIYHLGYQSGRFGLRPVPEADWAAGRVPKSGQFVALDQHTVDTATGIAQPAQATNSIARGYDRFTRGFKGLATATPGFHIRNLIGDTQMAYLSQPGHRLPGNLFQAGRATRAIFDQQKAVGDLGHALEPSGKTIKVAGESMPMEQFIGLAQRHGVVQSGYVGRELTDLAGAATRKGIKRVGSSVGRRVQSVMQAREDLVRLATFKHGLDSGMAPAKAADLSLETHIDYGELTKFERTVMRRIAPFYTFSARALPLHAKRLVQRPGKFATYEKAREEAGVGTGNDNLSKTQGDFTPWDQRQAPFLLGNQVVNASLPLNLLNELPSTNASVPQYTGELGQFVAGMANPLIKDPAELLANRSFFFRRDIQNKNAPLVAAPSWVALLPKQVRDQLGIVHDLVDKRSGKKVWGWPGKVDYVAKSLPGPVNAANQAVTAGTNQRGQGPLAAVASPLTGLKASPLDSTSAQINRLYNRQSQLSEQMAEMRQRQMQATPQYLALSTENRLITAQLKTLTRKRGDAIPPGRRPRRRAFTGVLDGSSAAGGGVIGGG